MIDPKYPPYTIMKTTTKQFINKANKVHHNRYGYDNTILARMNNKVKITCSIHGDFEQRAASHLEGSGCRLCNERQQLTTDEFITRSSMVHPNKYSYDGVKYVNVKTKVTINCNEHGVFEQTPQDHLAGYGCPSCGGTKKVTTNQFIKRARNIHKGVYLYTKTNICSMNEKVIITCPIHGDFNQRPADHINGSGCMECSLTRRGQYSDTYFSSFPDQQNIPAILYLARIDDDTCKIGITKRSAKKRLGISSDKIVVENKLSLIKAFKKEQQILNVFKEHRFRAKSTSRHYAGWTECFPLSLMPQLIQEISNDQ